MGYDHGFVVAEIPIGKAEQQTIAERLHLFSWRWLRNAVAAAASERIRRHRNGVRSGKSRLLRMGKVHVKIVFFERVGGIAQLDIMVRRSRWRRRSAVQVRGQEAEIVVVGSEANHGGFAFASEHCIAIEGAGLVFFD